ncbi:hypothetical protein HNQ08_002173 [Deinococcus humi]|uniref:Uncharacterized protein n=1 Tax=Deinococcus humi TaxID=662880 RepID=A0A7W8NEW1_9DEIO|nr:hypothetical protein [Deinococcus humi]GGO24850.1 hypothetical protein GCM10008949_14110 [Deinococcus humi]
MALIDRVRLVLATDPDAPLSRVCWCVGDSRPEMVATLMRMVILSGLRGSVAATHTALKPRHSTVNAVPCSTASLPASKRVRGSV